MRLRQVSQGHSGSQRMGGQIWPGCVAWMVWFRRCWQMVRGEAPEAGQEGG